MSRKEPRCHSRAYRGLARRQSPVRPLVGLGQNPAGLTCPAVHPWVSRKQRPGLSPRLDQACRWVARRRRSSCPSFQELTTPDLGRSAVRFHCCCRHLASVVPRWPAGPGKSGNRPDPCRRCLGPIVARQNLPSCRTSFRSVLPCPAALWADRSTRRFRLRRHRRPRRAAFL